MYKPFRLEVLEKPLALSLIPQVWVVCYRKVGAVANYLFLLLLVASFFLTRFLVFRAVFEFDLHPAPRLTCNIQMVIIRHFCIIIIQIFLFFGCF